MRYHNTEHHEFARFLGAKAPLGLEMVRDILTKNFKISVSIVSSASSVSRVSSVSSASGVSSVSVVLIIK